MSFTQIKSKSQSERGFTIVELLIVIVVIGILAAITIVSYTGITARANTNASKGNASTFIKKAELYLNDGTTGRYPAVDTELTDAANSSKSWYLTGLTVNYNTTLLTSASSSSTVRVLKCSAVGSTSSDTQAEITGASTGDAKLSGLKVYSFDYVNNAEVPVNVGNTTNCPAA